MTDNEIIKALERYCEEMSLPYIRIILNLIKRQQAEIDLLKAERDSLIKTYSECQIDFLKEFVEKLNSGFNREWIYRGGYVLGLIEVIAKGMVGGNND